jgi:hypothetical protein
MERSLYSKILSDTFYLVLFGLAIYAVITYRNEIRFVLKEDLWRLRPCSFTLTYSIGVFDTRFGITKDKFLNDIELASGLWESGVNKELFEYKETGGDIVINLIYDDRQKITSQLEEVSSTINEGKAEYELLKSKYSSLLSDYNQEKSTLLSKMDGLKVSTDSYNQKVKYWNQQGGAPKKEYDELAREKSLLDSKSSELKDIESSLNQKLPLLNQTVKDLNDTISKYNLTVKTYNEVGSTLDQEFDAGEYEQGLGKKSINIYQFDNDAKLIRVLAHEFGHALGLDHVEEEGSIMYYLNSSLVQELSESDVQAVKSNCRIK